MIPISKASAAGDHPGADKEAGASVSSAPPPGMSGKNPPPGHPDHDPFRHINETDEAGQWSMDLEERAS